MALAGPAGDLRKALLCLHTCLTFAEKNKAWKDVAQHPLLSSWPAGPQGTKHRRSTYHAVEQWLLSARLLQAIWWCVRVYLHVTVVSECALTWWLPTSSDWPQSQARCTAEGGEGGTGPAQTITSLGSYSGFTCFLLMDSDYLTCLAMQSWHGWPSGPAAPSGFIHAAVACNAKDSSKEALFPIICCISLFLSLATQESLWEDQGILRTRG